MTILNLHNISKYYLNGSEQIKAVDNVSLSISNSEMVAIMGPSGSGKSTLLQLSAGILEPSKGTVTIDGQNLWSLSIEERQEYRRNNIGYIFQQYNLIPMLTVRENIAVPSLMKNIKPNEKTIQDLAESLGIYSKLDCFPVELSGGEQQRVAIARALINDPKCIFADEPTGNLDRKATRNTMDILRDINHNGTTVIIVTHDPEVSRYCSRIIELHDGKIA